MFLTAAVTSDLCRKTRLSQPEKSRQFIHNILSFSCLSCQHSFSDGEYMQAVTNLANEAQLKV